MHLGKILLYGTWITVSASEKVRSEKTMEDSSSGRAAGRLLVKLEFSLDSSDIFPSCCRPTYVQ